MTEDGWIKARRLLNKERQENSLPFKYRGMTTKQIAEHLNISKNEVRRRKVGGAL